MSKPPVKVVICWHMHQPYYQDQVSKTYQQPWTYLHAIKDYIDMAALIEANPRARAVVNFCPTLLEQIDDYRQQVEYFFSRHTMLTDPLLTQLVSPTAPPLPMEQRELIRKCLRANEKHLIEAYPPFKILASLARDALASEEKLGYLNDQFFFDLITWYHLAWLGETVKQSNEVAKRLMTQGRNFSLQQRTQLLQLMGDLFSRVIPLYKRLADQNQVELSVTPYSHPILPLMLDVSSAKEAMPNAPIPEESYPGGEARADWQLEKAQAVFKHYFGREAWGCWPSEGAISEATVKLLARHQFKWAASGGTVLANSLKKEMDAACLHHPYRLKKEKLTCFFRDDNLSDMIGFNYSNWHSDDAVNNLMHHVGNIANACKHDPDTVISIILDGENCWEHYPYNGYYFLTRLYKEFSENPDVELTTFSECLEHKVKPRSLKHLVAGSWVHGTFSTWIGDTARNHSWRLLVEAKKAYDQAILEKRIPDHLQDQVDQQLAICEASDWNWWFGDYNSAESVSQFDQLYRRHLCNLYQLLGIGMPSELEKIITVGKGDPAISGTMRRATE